MSKNDICVLHKSHIPLGFRLGISMLVFVFLTGIYGLFFRAINNFTQTNLIVDILLIIVGFVLVAACLTFIIYLVIDWISCIYIISRDEIVIKKGVFNTHEEIYNFQIVKRVLINQNLFGKIFNYGDLEIRLGYRPNELAVLESVHNPVHLLEIIEKLKALNNPQAILENA